MDATNKKSRGRHGRRRRRRHHRHRSQSPNPGDPQPSQPPSPPPRSFSLPRVLQYVENKMGLPPPYEQTTPNPAPPPSYFGNNPPPPPGMVVPNAPPRTTVITNQPAAGPSAPRKLGPGPTGTACPTCNKTIVTRVDYVPNNRTHIVSAALCVLAGCCCGCLVPYCMKSCKTANHYCPQCKAFVGAYTPS